MDGDPFLNCFNLLSSGLQIVVFSKIFLMYALYIPSIFEKATNFRRRMKKIEDSLGAL